MTEFTKGIWIYYPHSENNRRKGVTECDIFAVQGRIGHFLGTIRYEANARLIAAAPEMYELMKIWVQVQAQPTLRNAQDKARELLARIDGNSLKGGEA